MILHKINFQGPKWALIASMLLVLVFSCNNKEEKAEKKNVTTTTKIKKEQPLFTALDSKTTGLNFSNMVPETEILNPLSYEYIYNGGGVCIGDINNDGLPDVFFSQNIKGGQLFLNKGNMKFENITHKSRVDVGGFATGATMVDINEDGFLDIYLCRSLSNEIFERENVLLINNGDLTFTNKAEEYGLADAGYSNIANFLDYDNDGDLDMYLLNHRTDFKLAINIEDISKVPGGEKSLTNPFYQYHSDRLYRNDGNGKFTDVTEEAGIINRGYGLSVTASDINKDGYIDIYVANDYVDRDYLYINNGDGTFTDRLEETFKHITKHSMGSDIADFNNDGHLDHIALDMISEDNYRQKQLDWLSTYDLYHLIVENGMYHQVVRNTLQLNNGDGTFSEIAQLSGISHTDWSWSPLFADYDNDGYKDLFISNGYYRDGNDKDYMKYESNTVIEKAGGSPNVKNLDLTKLMNSTPLKNYIYKNNGDMTFTKKSLDWGFHQSSFSQGAAYSDLDLDGDLDLIVNNFNSKSVLYQNNSEKANPNHNYLSIKLIGTPANPNGVGTKITLTSSKGIQYQECTPTRGFFSSSEPIIHFGLGEDDTAVKLTIEWLGGLVQELTNVSPNQRINIDIKNASKKEVKEKEEIDPLFAEIKNAITKTYTHQEDDFIDFKREPLLEHMISNKGPFLTKGDVNNDGLEDIFIGGGAEQAGMIYLQQQDGEFKYINSPAFSQDKIFEDQRATFFDADGDNDLDLYVVSGGYAHEKSSKLYADRLYINDGSGNYSRDIDALPELYYNGTTVTSHDIDNDGDLDLFIGNGALANDYPYDCPSILLLNEEGKFTNASDRLPAKGNLGMINDAVWADIDGDKNSELILAGEWMPITILKQNDGKFSNITSKAKLDKSGGWWNCVSVVDVNNDGKLDIVAGNRGDNSFFNATIDKPATMYANDYDGNGSVDAIPFYYYGNTAHPKHTLDEVFAHYPTIRRKFTRYKKYSTAVLTDFFSTEDLSDALILETHTFSSSVFLNQGDGSFTIQKLPLRAQFSEVHGILPSDIDKNGFIDLILTGNNYGTDVEMGRSDASFGVVLLNDGKGFFNALTPAESGFSVSGDSRGVYRVGDDILVLRNQDKPVAFEQIK